MQREAYEKSMPPFAVKTTAPPRVGQYIPVGGMGLAKPYGSHAPFKPSEIGSNARHIKKPQPRYCSYLIELISLGTLKFEGADLVG